MLKVGKIPLSLEVWSQNEVTFFGIIVCIFNIGLYRQCWELFLLYRAVFSKRVLWNGGKILPILWKDATISILLTLRGTRGGCATPLCGTFSYTSRTKKAFDFKFWHKCTNFIWSCLSKILRSHDPYLWRHRYFLTSTPSKNDNFSVLFYT